MIHTIIIDDEARAVKGLDILLTKFVKEVRVIATSTSAAQGVEIINNYRPDLVFLDINMPGMNGFELLDKLVFRNFHLVFSTAHREFGLKALKLNASDYLLKPIEIGALNATVERIRAKIDERQNAPDVRALLKEVNGAGKLRIPLVTKDNIEYILPEQIVYIEASSHHARVALLNGSSAYVKNALKDYEALLCRAGSQFMRIHHSFIINLQHVTTYLKEDGGYVMTKEKKSIPVSKHKKEEFFRRINLYGAA